MSAYRRAELFRQRIRQICASAVDYVLPATMRARPPCKGAAATGAWTAAGKSQTGLQLKLPSPTGTSNHTIGAQFEASLASRNQRKRRVRVTSRQRLAFRKVAWVATRQASLRIKSTHVEATGPILPGVCFHERYGIYTSLKMGRANNREAALKATAKTCATWAGRQQATTCWSELLHIRSFCCVYDFHLRLQRIHAHTNTEASVEGCKLRIAVAET